MTTEVGQYKVGNCDMQNIGSRSDDDPVKKINPDQSRLVDLYLVAYNAIDHQLQKLLHREKELSFSQWMKEYATCYPRWRDRSNKRRRPIQGFLR